MNELLKNTEKIPFIKKNQQEIMRSNILLISVHHILYFLNKENPIIPTNEVLNLIEQHHLQQG